MQAGTTVPVNTTGSKTSAALIGRAAEQYGERVAARHKVDGGWRDVTFAEAADAAREIGLGLIDLGIEPGDRVCILSTTRIEWTYCDFAISSAGAVVVPIYATNSPQECEWVAGNSEASAIVCENAAQLAKILAARDRLPHLRRIIVIDPSGDTADAIALDELRALGRHRDPGELEARTNAVGPDDTFTIIYTSGTTGPPKGCVLSHGNYRRTLDMCEVLGVLKGHEEIYLFLPLAHSFALLIQLLAFDVGDTIAYWSGDPNQIVPELQERRPDSLPSVPRIFEKVYTLVLSSQPPEVQVQMKAAAKLGGAVRDMRLRGEP